MNNQSKKWLLVVTAFITVVLLLLLVAQYFHISFEDARNWIESAPAWIFVLALFLLPPVGVPLSIFLIAVGARFNFLLAVAVACSGIVIHHLLAVLISQMISKRKISDGKATGTWEKLETRFEGNVSKLLFFWGLTPGIPYSIKLYLPLAMGVPAESFVKWNGAGHLIGAVLFVGLGQAVFKGVSTILIVFIGIALVLFISITWYRKKKIKAGG